MKSFLLQSDLRSKARYPLSVFALFYILTFLPFLGQGQCGDLFFTEYIEGGVGMGGDKCLEIYNPTNGSVSLDGIYSVQIYRNGSLTPNSTIILSGSIASGGVFLLCNQGETFAITPNQTSGNINFNGNDAATLVNNGTDIDVVGEIGNNNFIIDDVTLIRKSGISDGSTTFNLAADWNSDATIDPSNLGVHTSDSCATSTVVPTMSQWGLILFMLILVTMGNLIILNESKTLSIAGSDPANTQLRVIFREMPFDPKLYGKILLGVLAFAIFGFGLGTMAFGYNLTNADTPGILICAPVLAYLIFLLKD